MAGPEKLTGLLAELRKLGRGAEAVKGVVEAPKPVTLDPLAGSSANLPAVVGEPGQFAAKLASTPVSRRTVLKQAASTAARGLAPDLGGFAALGSTPLTGVVTSQVAKAAAKAVAESLAAPAIGSFETAALPGIMKALRAVADLDPERLSGNHVLLSEAMHEPDFFSSLKTALKSHVDPKVADAYGVTPTSVREFMANLDGVTQSTDRDWIYDSFRKDVGLGDALSVYRSPKTTFQAIVGSAFPKVKRLSAIPEWFDESTAGLNPHDAVSNAINRNTAMRNGLPMPKHEGDTFMGALDSFADGATDVMVDRETDISNLLMDWDPVNFLDADKDFKNAIGNTLKDRNTNLTGRANARRAIEDYRRFKGEVSGLRDYFKDDPDNFIGGPDHMPSREELGYADGGSIDNLTDEQYLRRVEALGRNGPVSGGRRPEHLNASRDVSMPLNLARGWAAGTLGLPGDLEGLGRSAISLLGYAPKMTGLGALVSLLGNKDIDTTPTLPTSEFYKEWLPGHDERPAAKAYNEMSSLAGGVGATKVAQGVEQGARGYGRVAAEALRRGVDEGRGPLGALQATVGPMHAVRPKGGNVDPVTLNAYLKDLETWVPEQNARNDAILREHAGLPPDNSPIREVELNKWINTQLSNYLKKDLGAPTDPLLQVEKEYPNLHRPELDAAAYDDIARELERNAAWGRQGRPGPNRSPKLYETAYEKVREHNRLHGGTDEQLQAIGPQGHEGLRGPVPMTPWSAAADSVVGSVDPEAYARLLLERKFSRRSDPAYAEYLSDHARQKGFKLGEGKLDSADELRAVDNYAYDYASGDGMGAYSLEALAPHSPKHAELLQHFNDARDQIVPPWIQKLDPNKDKIWKLPDDNQGYAADLGFSHVIDYLNHATEVHNDLKLPGFIPDELRARLANPQNNLDRRVANDYRRHLALHDAGLTLDPRSLGRLSVADAVRKTAQWNELVEAQKADTVNSELQRGIKGVHKDYGDGMKWVELGRPDIKELPEGYTLDATPVKAMGFENGNFNGPGAPTELTRYGVREPSSDMGPGTLHLSSTSALHYDPESALQAFYKMHGRQEGEAGLQAEGDAMGHCIGSAHCPQILDRGYRAFSLRDAKGNPHATIEMKPGELTPQVWDRLVDQHLPGVRGVGNVTSELERRALAAGIMNRGDSITNKALLGRLFPEAQQLMDNLPPTFTEIKGKQNAKPVDQYIPYIQDFVRNSGVHPADFGSDFHNTGLVRSDDAASVIQHHNYMSARQRNRVLSAVPKSDQPFWGTEELNAANAEAEKIFQETGVPVRPGTKLHELVMQAHQKGGINYAGNHGRFPGLYSPRELSLIGQYVAPEENLDYLKAMINNARRQEYGHALPDTHQVWGDFYDLPPEGWSMGEPKAAGGTIQKMAAGGKIGRFAAKLAEFVPEVAKAGTGSAKEARSAASRGGASFEQLSAHPSAVRERGGNFYDYDLGSYIGNESLRVIPSHKIASPHGTYANMEEDFGRVGQAAAGAGVREGPVADWANAQLVNYLKKDLGSPADPLLQVEKEYPNLHMSEDALDFGRLATATYPERLREALEDLKFFGGDRSKMNRWRLSALEHHDLSKGAPLTPWGAKSDRTLTYSTPKQLIAGPIRDVAEMGTFPEGYPNISTQTTREWVNEAFPDFVAHPENQDLLGRFKWLQNAPDDTKIWQFEDPQADPLHFGHVLDYLDAATKPHIDVARMAGDSDVGQALDMIRREGRNAMLPFLPQHMDNWQKLMNAGLDLDPQSLGRLSVADAVRKTAQWNEHLASGMNGPMNPDLARGIVRTHKEYPDSGMKWVELGIDPSQPLASHQLPMEEDGVHHIIDDVGNTLTPSPRGYLTAEAAKRAILQQELEAGLNAEGKAMGHCVGGYCDDVADRGTKIYSLRDKAGNPHVTVETRPGKIDKRKLGNMPDPGGGFGNLHLRVQEERRGNGDYDDYARSLMNFYDLPLPEEDIIQIKGKQNAAPVAKYLPQVQDFVRNGKWGSVGDLPNAGLRDISGWKSDLTRSGSARDNEVVSANFDKLFGSLGRHATTDELDDIVVNKLKMPRNYNFNDLHRGLYNYQLPTGDPGYATGGKVVRSRFEAALAAGRK